MVGLAVTSGTMLTRCVGASYLGLHTRFLWHPDWPALSLRDISTTRSSEFAVASGSSRTHNGPMFERYSDRARCLIFMALWSAGRRGGSYIEPEDLLHALIREDRGEFPAISAEVFPGAGAPNENSAASRRSFFSGNVATNLLRELHEETDPLNAEARGERREPVPHVDMPISHSLKKVLALVAKAHQDNTKIIEPLDLLAGIVENRDSTLAQLLRDHGVTRQKVVKALDSGS